MALGQRGRPRVGYRLVVASLFLARALWSSESRADGIDAWWLLTRVPMVATFSENRRVLIVGAVLAFDYFLNVVVVGLPASRFGVSVRRSAREIIVFTVLAQCMDRFGMFVSLCLVGAVRSLMPGTVTMAVLVGCVPYILAVNFILSGAMIWILAEYYLTVRWNVSRRPAIRIATAAAVLTNPAWAMLVIPLLGLMGRR